MGGLGKSTLAQLVYNDKKVQKHFDLVAWVCVSEEFDVFKLTKTILESVVASWTTCNIQDLNQLQLKLKEKLMGKKFLLILDDVWNRSYTECEILSNSFKSGAQGSRIIITTRDVEVASAMRAFEIHHLKELQDEDCWKLFARHAFLHDANSYMHSKFEELGRQIVKKCKGLPLAIKTIGALLRSKVDVSDWDKVLNSEIWSLSNEILPALRLSYKHLPSYIKLCFAYCSIFPKDHPFKKDELVLLWMAEGLLHEIENKTMEEVGNDYFVTLVSRSLFQKSSEDELCFVMHDLINDLAKFVSGEFTFRLEVDSRSQLNINKTRHVSCAKVSYENFKKFEGLQEATQLRTFLALESSRACYYATKNCCLYDCRDLETLPRDMQKLVNLRHLDLTGTRFIIEMPIHMGKLKFLQTLTKFVVSKRTGCSIRELGELENLRGAFSILYLENVESFKDAEGACLRNKMDLKELALNWKKGSTIEISESQRDVLNALGHLPSLQNLSIVGFDGIVAVGEEFYGSTGSSSIKPFGALKVLRFGQMLNWEKWISFGAENIGAFHRLEKLSIWGCSKLTGDLPIHLHSLGFLEIIDCPNMLASLPRTSAICQLKLTNCGEDILRELPIHVTKKVVIGGFDAVDMGDFFSHMSLPVGGLPSTLKTLEINYCKKLGLPKNLDYSCLDVLNLISCDSPRSFPMDLFPNVKDLKIGICGNLEYLTVAEQVHQHDLVALSSLIIEECPNFVSFPRGGLHTTNLGSLRISNCESLRSLPDKMHMLLPSLTEFSIRECTNIETFPEGGLPSSLNELYIRYCEKLVDSQMGWSLQNLASLTDLEIIGGSKLDVVSFPEIGWLPTNLTTLKISEFPNLTLFNKNGFENITSLKRLSIDYCPKLESMPEEVLQCLSSLKILSIWNCPNLEYRMLEEELQHLTSLSVLEIKNCPLLTKRRWWERRKGKEWRRKLAHIPIKLVDRELID
ncbi:putative disease resistance protein At3g14460 [Juglans regia]|uniref:Disease resistance protein At3g14460 n=1 Tax=Juglans regia TaxID=51240 RepID=A0A6P9EEW5_JUGRE|nr:putative disease resistance protein At3g14460 [Juglans regia]